MHNSPPLPSHLPTYISPKRTRKSPCTMLCRRLCVHYPIHVVNALLKSNWADLFKGRQKLGYSLPVPLAETAHRWNNRPLGPMAKMAKGAVESVILIRPGPVSVKLVFVEAASIGTLSEKTVIYLLTGKLFRNQGCRIVCFVFSFMFEIYFSW